MSDSSLPKRTPTKAVLELAGGLDKHVATAEEKTRSTRDQLEARRKEITAELVEIERTRIVPADGALGEKEQALLAEQEEIRHKLWRVGLGERVIGAITLIGLGIGVFSLTFVGGLGATAGVMLIVGSFVMIGAGIGTLFRRAAIGAILGLGLGLVMLFSFWLFFPKC